eukprot:scaffold37469_cov76-Attheya_sp.AAC.3
MAKPTDYLTKLTAVPVHLFYPPCMAASLPLILCMSWTASSVPFQARKTTIILRTLWHWSAFFSQQPQMTVGAVRY